MSAPRSPSGEPLAAGPPWGLIAVVLLPLAIRLAAAGAIHLTEDEAYYRLWSFAPAFGYFDHPPMIAWWIALGRSLVGDTALGVRLLPTLACALVTLLVFDLAGVAGADRATAERAAIFYGAMLLVAAGGFLAVPDSPATLFWTATLCCAFRARRGGELRWWLLAGLAAGLASLSKYSALFLAPGVALWLLASPGGRAELRRPGPWLAAAVAAAVFTPNVWWNGQHHWLTFAKQFGRVGAGHFAPIHLAELLVGQAFLINPLIAVFAVRGLARERRLAGSALGLGSLLSTSAPFAAYLLFHSLHDRVQAHWPAPLYPAIAIVAAAGAQSSVRGWARLRRLAAALGFTLAAGALVWLCMPSDRLALPADPALPIRDWQRFSQRLEQRRLAAGAAWVGVASYGLEAQLAGQGAIGAPVIELFERSRYQGLALGPPPDLTRPGLVVDLARRIDIKRLRVCFETVAPVGALRRGDGGGPAVAYVAIRVAGPSADLLAAGCPPVAVSAPQRLTP